MKKRYLKIYLSIYLSIILIINLFLNNSFYSFADVPSTQKVVGHNSSWGNYDFNYVFHRKYFTIQDSTGIPTAPISAPYFFYTEDKKTFYTIDGTDLIQLVLNRGIGIILEPTKASALISAFFLAITQPDLQNVSYAQGGLYDSSGNFLGYCLNDISGCYFEGIPQDQNQPAIDIPSETTNNVYNFYNKYISEHGIPVDYITVYSPSNEFIRSHYKLVSDQDALLNFLHEINAYNTNGRNTSCAMTYNSSGTDFEYIGYADNSFNSIGSSTIIPSGLHFINTGNWNNFCNSRGLVNGNTDLLFSEMWLNPLDKSGTTFDPIDSNGNIVNTFTKLTYYYTNPPGIMSENTNGTNIFYIGYTGVSNGRQYQTIFSGDNYTIYKDSNVYNGINVDKNYKSDIYITKIYKTYNTNNDNSIRTTTIDIDNAPQNNTDIRDDISDVINNNEDNSIINNNTINTNNIDNSVTEITINIYNKTSKPNTNNDPGNTPTNPDDPDNPTNPDDPDNPTNPDDPDNPDNPDDPDNPTNPDDPDDGDSILDKLLSAILKLFDTLGKLLATVLTGIITVLDDVLGAIGDIMTSLTGVVDFFTALFGWIPEPVPQVIALAFSITILCALIKFIRG